ncbi:MAG: hypothetical protein AB1724_16390 [Thermodesulfobacteriota bacterium]
MKRNKPFLLSGNRAGLMLCTGLLMACVFFSCGRKLLPVPPDAYIPAAAKGVGARFDAGAVNLSWVVPDGRREREKGLSEMVVFRASHIEDCPSCPLNYEPVATLSAWEMTVNDQGDLQGFFRVTVDGQGLFSFYVVTYSKKGVAGPKSDKVEINCPGGN